MHRRTLITAIGATTLAGCAGSDSEPDDTPGDENGTDGLDQDNGTDDTSESDLPDQPAINAENTTSEDATSTLAVRWNATVFEAVKFEGDNQFWEAEDGEHYLIFHAELTNTGEETIAFAPGQITVDADGTEGGWTVLDDGQRLDVELDAGESATDWVAFTIPDDAEEIMITANASDYAIEFEHDTEMDLELVSA